MIKKYEFSIGPLVLILFLLKLSGLVSWSWWWVLSPIWLPIAIGLGLGAIFLIALLIVMIVAAIF